MEPLSLVLLAISISLLTIKFLKFPHCRKNLPPGPRPWPIVGNLNLIGLIPHQSFHKLSQTYGKLMHLRLGSFAVVVASSADMARELLTTHDGVFASRPPTVGGKLTNNNYHGVLWAPYGNHWIQGRKIHHNEVFNSKRLESLEYIRVQEMQIFVSRLHVLSRKPILLKDHFLSMNLGVINRIVLGWKYFNESKEDDKEVMGLEEFQEMLDEFFLLNGVTNVGEWMPWMRFMDLQGYVKRMKALFKRFDRFNEHVLEDHRERIRAEREDFVAKDVVDVLLKLAEDPNLEVQLNSDAVKGLMQDLIIGGTDTTTTTMEWAMSELIKQPHLIEKATEELDRVIGKVRWVQETDFTNLPFIDSILKEIMRLHPPVPLLAPHLALEDCKVAGYDVTRGTIAFINAWSIGRDSHIWDEPEAFRPERFLGKDIDVKGQHFELIPFGSGRRICPGYMLALKTMGLLMGNMLQGFNWMLPENMRGEDLNMEEFYGLVTRRRFPLVIVTEPRLPAHMYN